MTDNSLEPRSYEMDRRMVNGLGGFMVLAAAFMVWAAFNPTQVEFSLNRPPYVVLRVAAVATVVGAAAAVAVALQWSRADRDIVSLDRRGLQVTELAGSFPLRAVTSTALWGDVDSISSRAVARAGVVSIRLRDGRVLRINTLHVRGVRSDEGERLVAVMEQYRDADGSGR